MNGLDQFGEEDTGTVFRDTIMLALAGFVSVVVLLLPHINPKAKEAEAGVTAPGNVIIEAQWADGLDADVDLWVRAPGDRPVGYSNKAGKIFNLLRDDLGKPLDITNLNYEVAYTRGTPAGDYVINLHLYRALVQSTPVDVRVVASVRKNPSSDSTPLVTTTVPLKKVGQELTAIRFKLDAKGGLVPGSLNSIYKPLRAAGS
ncbi:MAG TPA: hypothetical protein VH835_07820 [Dongiaceae bacterium]|jgi:hypothetical protein